MSNIKYITQGSVMAHHIQLIILFVLGFLGWSLFGYTLVSSLCNRKREIKIVNEINQELKKIRSELNKLK